MNIPKQFTNINNLKIMKKFDNYIKERLKSESKKPKVIYAQMEVIQKQIVKQEKEQDKKDKHIIMKYPLLCNDCNRRYKNKKSLKDHKRSGMCDYTGIYMSNWRQWNHSSLDDYIDSMNRSINKITNIIKDLESTRKMIKEQIRNLSTKCQKCNKKNKSFLEELNCSHNHVLCHDCLDNHIDDGSNNCPVCDDIINMKKCPICMGYKGTMVDLSCGNTHPYQICITCFDSILNSNAQCPFCRVIMN